MPSIDIKKSSDAPLRVILEKSRSEKIIGGIWTFAKIFFFFLILSTFFQASQFEYNLSGVQKNYFDNYYGPSQKDITAKEVAVIPLFGEIVDTPPASSLASSNTIFADDVIHLLNKAMNDEEVAAVLLRIDSPGGTVLASEKIAHMINVVREKKPVFSLLEASATSGGYYIASASNKIYAYRNTLTGNIGVIILLPKAKELFEKIGIEMRTLKSGEYKDMGSSFRDLTSKEQQIFEDLITESYEGFVSAVAKGRDMPVEEIKKLADGRVYSGTEAAKNGLIDSTVYSFAEVMDALSAELSGTKLQAVSFKLPFTPWWEEFLLGIKTGNLDPESISQFFKRSILGSGPRLLSI